MKTLSINSERSNLRFEEIRKSQIRCQDYLRKLAIIIDGIKKSTGMLVVLLFITLSSNAQLVKTNFIGKTTAEVKTVMNRSGMTFYNTNIDTNTGKLFTAYVDQYFGTIIYTFNKNICESYIIKSAYSHANAVLNIISKEFPIKDDLYYTNGKHTATMLNSEYILTIKVQ